MLVGIVIDQVTRMLIAQHTPQWHVRIAHEHLLFGVLLDDVTDVRSIGVNHRFDILLMQCDGTLADAELAHQSGIVNSFLPLFCLGYEKVIVIIEYIKH